MVEPVKLLKRRLRSDFLRRRDAIPSLERSQKSAAIITRLCALPDIATAHVVFIYVSFKSEVATLDCIEQFFAERKTVAVPYTDVDRRLMIPVQIHSLDDLSPGPRGILQPPALPGSNLPSDAIDVVIVPGVAFTHTGIRLGYGGGYYDAFLRHHALPSYGLAFEAQLCRELPFEPDHDMRVQYIVTEQRLISCTQPPSE